MNRIHRLIWNQCRQCWQAVCETAKSNGKGSTRTATAAAVLVLGASASFAADLPGTGQVIIGAGAITRSADAVVVNQTTPKLGIEWQGFSIGAGKSVTFVQPSSASVALNRVLGSEVSTLQGTLSANGQVFLINPNGVLFSPTARVDVGGLVASTLDISNSDFIAGRFTLEGASTASVVNQGRIQARGAQDGSGVIALVAAKVVNEGVLDAPRGNVLLGAGSRVRLDLGGPVQLSVEKGALEALIANSGAIYADGGRVILSAKAADELSRTVINTSGLIQAQTLATGESGTIVLLGGMDKDSIQVGGKLDASAPNGGAGGFIETSAADVRIAADVHVTTASPTGTTGRWLIDPDILESSPAPRARCPARAPARRRSRPTPC